MYGEQWLCYGFCYSRESQRRVTGTYKEGWRRLAGAFHPRIITHYLGALSLWSFICWLFCFSTFPHETVPRTKFNQESLSQIHLTHDLPSNLKRHTRNRGRHKSCRILRRWIDPAMHGRALDYRVQEIVLDSVR
ncbi:hypothetical protein BDV12DRAFT_177193 [Aspergillus spectabilis]